MVKALETGMMESKSASMMPRSDLMWLISRITRKDRISRMTLGKRGWSCGLMEYCDQEVSLEVFIISQYSLIPTPHIKVLLAIWKVPGW